jgi:hypothetical protein
MEQDSIVIRFAEKVEDVIFALRNADGLQQADWSECLRLFEEIAHAHKDSSSLPKELVSAVQVLRDNLVGALSDYKSRERAAIVQANAAFESRWETLLH